LGVRSHRFSCDAISLMVAKRFINADFRHFRMPGARIDQTGMLRVRREQMDQSSDPRYKFDTNPTVDELIAQQGKGLIGDPRILLGDLWPDDEPIEEFLAALHEWRGHNRSDRAA